MEARPCSGVIFTDLDNTLVGPGGEAGEAGEVYLEALDLGYRVVPVTSKSIYEIVELWDSIGVPPGERIALAESGGAIYGPRGSLARPTGFNSEVGLEYTALGKPLASIDALLDSLAETCGAVRLSKADATEAQLITGLPRERAALAARREYLEVIWSRSQECLDTILSTALRYRELTYVHRAPRTVQIAAHRGKGMAIDAALQEPLLRPCAKVVVTAGDSSHDIPIIERGMLAFRVDYNRDWSRLVKPIYMVIPYEAPKAWTMLIETVKTRSNTPSL
ncbi:mannosyl-3-phosphoglycerate phosphatase [Aeropyrum pernix K1]|uniref:Mannosyl-3-phosphoglycerate phosphatase n=1 Tax=Aeropyrum pernix (strain ATCC 700893 / DSM 11879 / JCM 9820 / NBRC 100138 / K1) TaxID=272557 RepID=MPGP_AERPE|nr:mannosyl-3-phosphoglycerate phosphatase [Aeropyrum pernix]Q9YDM7.2 RecName: Full=Mannosyl-3-phosphoglycerate phosphatase; Short=MPGP [Aeropyrum pernix K1]BAA79870.2 mannosyl-3-phosphoglycerate phosphatase [Aeropyrum pernix K1]